MSFKSATSVTDQGGGIFGTSIVAGWDIGGRANGGYLLGLAGRTMREASGRAHPVSITAHFLRPGLAGPATVTTEVVKRGRSFATVTAQLAADQPVMQLLGTFGDLQEPGPDDRILASAPEMPDPDACIALKGSDSIPPPMMNQLDLRLHPEDNFYDAAPSGTPQMRGWLRLKNDEAWDTIAVLMASDAFPPTAFNGNLGMAWTPTLELTVHVRAQPASEWLRCSFRSRFISGGFIEEDGELWDETGTLVAQSRQIALVPRPEPL